jgi:hypothetical protein
VRFFERADILCILKACKDTLKKNRYKKFIKDKNQNVNKTIEVMNPV